ncbi:helix-hairpin-helix domain-containing protein [Pseudorhodobacter sp.]|uniref:helix-hairpin-helix domain-containing protein n=1 Tax=Pseudorhodobacter sp. TaxID=1934400 RepID=UPI0034639CEA
MVSHPGPATRIATISDLRNFGESALADFQRLGIRTVAQLSEQNADDLYIQLCQITGCHQDPCVHDVFSATIHRAQTGEPLNWWAFTKIRKERQLNGGFPQIG